MSALLFGKGYHVKVVITCNTTVLRDGITADQAREMRMSKRPQQDYKRAISVGDVLDVSAEQAKLWFDLGYAKAHADDAGAKTLEPDDIDRRAEEAKLVNQGQGNADEELNLQHAQIANEAHAAVVQRLNG